MNRFVCLWGGGWLLLGLLWCGGCRRQATLDEPAGPHSAALREGASVYAGGNSASPAPQTAEQILRQLVDRCRKAHSYQDQGVIRLAYRQSGQSVRQQWPWSVAWRRPNRLRVQAFQASVWCDGRQLAAQIRDPLTADLDGQVLLRPAPERLTAADLTRDPLLEETLRGRIGRLPAMVELLLPSQGLMAALGEDVACRRLEDGSYDGRVCYRVEVVSPGGPLVFWVDQQTGGLRRLDLPAAQLLPELAADPTVSDLALFGDLEQAGFDEAIPETTFAPALPPGARQVTRFVVPPPPLPSELLGQRPPGFFFTTEEGQKLTDAELTGAITILVWYQDHPACQATLQQVAQARRRLADRSDVRCYAVATEPASVPSEFLRQRLDQWQAELPILRDLEAYGDSVFHIQVQPTLVVLDRQGRVQTFQAGGNPELAGQLVALVERLQAGQDIAAEVRAAAAESQRQYQELLLRGGGTEGEIPPPPPEAVIRRATEPSRFRLVPRWRCTDLRSPGNLLLVPSPAGDRLYVLEGWRQVAELDAEGQIVARHPLDLPTQAGVTFLRTATDAQGQRYFLAGAPLAPQCYVFDAHWQLQLAYPPPGHAPLALVDLAGAALPPPAPGEGEPSLTILLASAGDVGLAAISLDGQTRWRNRTFANALSAAVYEETSPAALRLYVPGEDGSVLAVDAAGKHAPPQRVGRWPIVRLVAGRFRSPQGAVLLGIAHDEQWRPFAVGLTPELKEVWNYPLPLGAHTQPIEPITSSDLWAGTAGQWWLAGPDGSIHLILADGQWFDSFCTGAVLGGLAAGIVGGQPTLVVATPEHLVAWRVEPVPQAASGTGTPPVSSSGSKGR